VVRRAERSKVTAGLDHDHPHSLEAVNRLSDVLFVVARNADGRETPSRGKTGAGRPRSVFGSLYSYAAQSHLERE
jgi:cob(I)alamin adenosyltransferase